MTQNPEIQALLNRIDTAANALKKGLTKKLRYFDRRYFSIHYFSVLYFK